MTSPAREGASPEGSAESEGIEVVLSAIRMAARDTNLYSFQRPDGGPLPDAEPGAHIGIILPNGVERQYSLIRSGSPHNEYFVGVKRDAGSRGGSLFMHDQLRVGTLLRLLPPRNNFPLREDADRVVLIAGGIGVTPIYCMILRVVALGRPWELYYSSRSRRDAAFHDELRKFPAAHFHFVDEDGGQ